MNGACEAHQRRQPDRRRLLHLGLVGAAWLLAGGHAPYGQWSVYRKRFLLILTTREDPASFALGQQVAAALAAQLPDSNARVSRAPHRQRVASLIATKQMDVALMRREDAAALRAGAAPFAQFGQVPLRSIVGIGEHLLVCRDDFPAHHAWLLAEALVAPVAASPAAFSAAAVAPLDAGVPLHPGAEAYFAGRSLPEIEPGRAAADVDAPDGDHHAP